MAVVYYHRLIRRKDRYLRRERVFRDNVNPLDYLDATDIICKYRLPGYMITDLCRRFNGDLKRPILRSRSLPVSLQVMVALSFYATGSFQAVTTILENSALKICLRAMPFPKDGFLGIVGRPRLLTPVINPTSQPEERYNAKFWCSQI